MLISMNYDFQGNQLLSPVIHNLASAPGSSKEGQLYCNTASHTINAYLNGAWTVLTTAGGTITGGGTANQLTMWTSPTAIGGITAVNSAVLVTDGSGIPSLSTQLPTAITLAGSYIYRAGGTKIAVADGGTNLGSFTQFGILYAPTTGSLGQVTDVSVTGKALVSTSGGAPVFGSVTLTQTGGAQAVLTIAAGKTVAYNNSVTFNNTDSIVVGLGGYNLTFTTSAATSVTLPVSGTLVGSTDTGTVTNTMLAGSIANNKLVNSTILLGGQTLTLGAAATTALTNMTSITHVAGTATVAPIYLTSGALLTTPVAGAFEFVTDTLSFTISTGTARKTIAFTDSAMTGSYAGSLISGQYGGTGVNNTGKTLTMGGNWSSNSTVSITGALSIGGALTTSSAFTTTGAFTTSLTQGANLTLTMPAVATASMLYNTANPSVNQLAFAGGANGLISYQAFPVSLTSVLTQTSAGVLAWAAASVTLGSTSIALGATVSAIAGLTLTGSSYNGITPTANTAGFTLAGGTTSKSLQVNNSLTLAGTDTSVLTFNGTFTTGSTFSTTGAFSTSAAFSTTGSGTLALSNGSTNSTLTLPGVATATLNYITANPATANLLAYSGGTNGLLAYVAAPSVLSILTQSSNAAAPAFTTVTGTGAPVCATDPTMSFSTQGHLQVSYVPASANDVINKAYADALAQGTPIKGSAKIAVAYAALPANTYSNGPGTITGTGNGPLPVINGYTPVLNDLILVTSSAGSVSDGLYKLTQLGVGGSSPYILTRDLAMDAITEFSGSLIAVEPTDTTFPASLWLNTNTSAIVLGTTPITFMQMNKPTDWTFGAGLKLTGTLSQTIALDTATFNQYGLFYAGTTTQLAQVSAPGVSNQLLASTSGGAPAWSTLVFTPTGGANATLAIAAGKTVSYLHTITFDGTDSVTVTMPGSTGTVLYNTANPIVNAIPYAGGASGLVSYLSNITTTKMFLSQTGTGAATNAPVLAALTSGDITTALAFTPVKKFTQTFTGAGPTFGPYTHGLGSALCTVSIFDNSGNLMMADVLVTSTQATVTCGYGVPGAGTYTLVLCG